MTPEQFMAAIREATTRWSKRYAERIPNEYPAGSNPHHDDGYSDYAEHHDIVSMPQPYAGLLQAEIDRITQLYLAPDNAANRMAGV